MLGPDNVSPLRYPGGKTRACKHLDEIAMSKFNLSEKTTIVSPFFGGGSFEFFIQRKYNLKIIANDKFYPVSNFWLACKNSKNYWLYSLPIVSYLITYLQ